MHQGQNVPAPFTFNTKMDAQTWLKMLRTDMTRGTWKPAADAPPLTFGEYAGRWLEQRDLKPRTRKHYRVLLDRFLLTCGASVSTQHPAGATSSLPLTSSCSQIRLMDLVRRRNSCAGCALNVLTLAPSLRKP
jgi:hypothetical protein